MNYLAYDVETASTKEQGSICQIGWVLFSNQGIIRTGGTLINPETSFSSVCIKVHGITGDDVQDSPTFPEYWESTLRDLMMSSLVVSYNATFDIRATILTLRRYHLADPGIDYVDVLNVCRRLVPTEKHTLADVMGWAGMAFEHHDAAEDAMAIFRILNAVRRFHHFRCVGEVLQCGHSTISISVRMDISAPSPVKPDPPVKRSEPVAAPDVVDHALDGVCFCVTGDIFDGSGRDQVETLIISHGGIVKASMSKKVRYLVCGDYKDYPAGYQSTKAKRAEELRQAGVQVDDIAMAALISLIESRGDEP